MATPGSRPPFEALVRRVGMRRTPLSDVYAFLLRARWSTVAALAAVMYLGVNSIFALLYGAVPGCVSNSSGSFVDNLYFSVQTFGTIGYGYMYPVGTWGNVVVVIESFTSTFFIALLTGIVFAKFARPHARVLFSRAVCVETRDGKPTLSFRLANERGNDVVEASVKVSALKTEVTTEGKTMRRFSDVRLQRDASPVFLMSWQVFHTIDESSPLYGLDEAALARGDVRLAVSLTGLDGTFAQTIHARHMYYAEDFLFGHSFVDVMTNLAEGVVEMDFAKFHDTVPE